MRDDRKTFKFFSCLLGIYLCCSSIIQIFKKNQRYYKLNLFQKLTRFAMAIPEFTDATLDQPLAKKILLLHNIDPMFNIRNAFFFQSDATSITAQLNRFGIFDMSLVDTLRSNLFSGILGKFRNLFPLFLVAKKSFFLSRFCQAYDLEAILCNSLG